MTCWVHAGHCMLSIVGVLVMATNYSPLATPKQAMRSSNTTAAAAGKSVPNL
jgi:hypothetical protein